MNIKRFFQYPTEVIFLCLASYFSYFIFFNALIIPFYRDWGGLSQFQVALLGSIYAIFSILLEIPTGIFGDLKGRKFSVICGYICLFIGPIVYASAPHFGIFVIGELIFAFGFAFVSGAEEALMYDILKSKNRIDLYPEVAVFYKNMQTLGILSASIIIPFALQYLAVHNVVKLESVAQLVALFILVFFIKEPTVVNKVKIKLKPDYKSIYREAIYTLRSNAVLRRLTFFYVAMYGLGYFVKYFYQLLLKDLNVPIAQYGFYYVALLLFGIIGAQIVVIMLKQRGNKRRIFGVIAVLGALGYFLPVINLSHFSVVIFLLFSGWLLNSIWNLLTPFINSHIESSSRATVLSFISLVEHVGVRLIINPFFGFMVDINLYITFVIIGTLGILIAIFITPREADLSVV